MAQPLPPWHWPYTVFRFADGATAALIPLAAVIHYGYPAWGVAAAAAAMNVASVPASYLWGALMEDGAGRRRLATAGFACAGLSMAGLALLPRFPLYLLAAAAFTGFGVATASAAGRLSLEGQDRRGWATAVGRIQGMLAWSYLAGVVATVAWSLTAGVDLGLLFALAAGLSIGAAVVAWWAIPPWSGPERICEEHVVVRRRFEKPVWFPSRLRWRPRWRPPWGALDLRDPLTRILAGITLLFFGAITFFSTYPGVLAHDLGLAVGLVLLAQAPAHLAIPITFGWAGRMGDLHGEHVAGRWGLGLRLLTFLALMAVVWAWRPGLYGALLALGLLLGVSFSLLQVNLSCIVAALHPRSQGRGMGAYQAAFAVGTLAGSFAGFVTLAWASLQVSYITALLGLALGTAILWKELARIGALTTTPMKGPSS